MTFPNFAAALAALKDDAKVVAVNEWVQANATGDHVSTNSLDTARLLLVARDCLQIWFNNSKAREEVDPRLQLALNAIDRAFWVSNLEDEAHGLID